MCRVVALVGVIGLMVQGGLTLADVLLRWLANAPIRGLEDINGLVITIVIASCFPIVVARRQNVSIKFLGKLLGAAGERWLEVLSSTALLVFLVLIGWQLIAFIEELAESGRTTWLLQWPVTPYWIVATAVYALCVPVQLAIVLADVAKAVLGKDPSDRLEGA